MNKKVSIITATYNDGNYLQECIDSVLNQSYQDWEWVIVNNGSSDNTANILASVTDERIKRITLERNEGVSKGRNQGLDKATGGFICFLDGDDILPAESIAARLKIFEGDENVGFVDGCVLTFKRDKSNVIAEYKPIYRGEPLSRLLSLDGSVFMGNTWMIKIEHVGDLRFDSFLTHGEEMMFYIKACKPRIKFDFTDVPVLLYRKHANSAMANIDGQQKSFVRIIKELKILSQVTQVQERQFALKASSIILKSYLKQGKIWKAIDGALRILIA